ncbi:hypothetical protein K443DRAFT_12023 [Laccaria amethystina LaAM-08-1]|uniref:Uncharacterized protein n=1 Tax=Laccaria amethystina LaAM-08-1 TaxID=1095629 RepID=A0A0C9WSD2_9AGAR|nr:hypothetical protein K443DRAFT_12023 [Laccaria amethystina LaAM-08-1]
MHVPFSDATVLNLTQANIKLKVLEWNSDGKSQAQHRGGKTTPNVLSLDETTKQIGYIRKHIAFETVRGCVTTGEEWLFFIYNKNKDGPGGNASYLPPIHLEHDLSGLPLILGLLFAWIENGQQKTLKFCKYPD